MRSKLFSPFWLPIWFFAGAICAGAGILHYHASLTHGQLSWIDAFFTATSAICVTGLTVVDTGSFFTHTGQATILAMIQLGGLGIMTYASLAGYMLSKRVSMTDRIAVGQSLLHDPSFKIGNFLMRVLVGTAVIEFFGALGLYLLDPVGFHPYSAVFHSISAFCNAGFSLYPDSLMAWRTDWGVNIMFMTLITLGGLGFFVINECLVLGGNLFSKEKGGGAPKATLLSWHTRIVLTTSLFLVIVGTLGIFTAEILGGERVLPWSDKLLLAMFQSVTCRTAGFNTVEISHMTNVSLVLMLALMFIGGSPGSCAGGIKTTTFRAWWAFVAAQFRGRDQSRIGGRALNPVSMHKALTLMIMASGLVALATLVLNITEGGDIPHVLARGVFLETLFEAVSAFGTVGLSTGLTSKLGVEGKAMVIVLMFVGRLGPIWLLSAFNIWRIDPHYRYPEKHLPLG